MCVCVCVRACVLRVYMLEREMEAVGENQCACEGETGCIDKLLQCVAMCCSVLQCACKGETECIDKVLQCVTVCCNVMQCVAVCCSVLQCVAVCCSVLQCVAEWISSHRAPRPSLFQNPVCCSVLQCVAVCCSELQCVAARCTVMYGNRPSEPNFEGLISKGLSFGNKPYINSKASLQKKGFSWLFFK